MRPSRAFPVGVVAAVAAWLHEMGGMQLFTAVPAAVLASFALALVFTILWTVLEVSTMKS